MPLEAALASILLNATTSVAVDLISKRTIDPKIKLVGGVYRCLSLFDVTSSLTNAIRLSAYIDAGNIIANEIIIEFASSNIQSAIGEPQPINFDLVRAAEALLISHDKVDGLTQNRRRFDPIFLSRANDGFMEDAFETSGGNVAEITLNCVGKAISAAWSASKVIEPPDAFEIRKQKNWSNSERWLDRMNTGLGYALWRPVLVIGVGT